MEKKIYDTYEKPTIKFVSLRNEETIANTCWGGHGKDMYWYYDSPGTGYLKFNVASGSCDSSLIRIAEYIDVPDDLKSNAVQSLMSVVPESGGNGGEPWKGEKTITPPTPDPSWS